MDRQTHQADQAQAERVLEAVAALDCQGVSLSARGCVTAPPQGPPA